MVKVNLYEVCLSYFIYCVICYIMTILTPFFDRFVASLTPEARSIGSIGHKDLIQKRTSSHMNGVVKGF